MATLTSYWIDNGHGSKLPDGKADRCLFTLEHVFKTNRLKKPWSGLKVWGMPIVKGLNINRILMIRTNLLLAITACICSRGLSAQMIPSPKELHTTIASMDSLFFHAFNNCDVETSKSFFTEDLEFYHDAGGLTDYLQNIRSIEQRCSRETKVRRELVEGSLQVFPIKDFGAIEIGSHRFYYTEKGKQEQLDGTFKFVHIWKNVNGKWKMCRVISYDH